MADVHTSKTSALPITAPLPTKVQFIQYHKPGVQDGDYQLDLETHIQSTGGEIDAATPYTHTLKFSVQGERFSLNPQEIQAVFPPADSLGDHSHCLPHVILHRSTLPWERSVIDGDKNTPWLTILLFDAAEQPPSKSMTLKDLKKTPSNQFPAFDYKSAQHPNDPVTVIDVPKTLLQQILPSAPELALMAHVRQGLDQDDQALGPEFAVVIGNQLPKPGHMSVAHLVSVEDRYTPSGFNFSGMGDTVRLVSLKSWRFTCTDPAECFEKLLLNLNRTPNTLRLPKNPNADAERYLSQGYSPLRYARQQGDRVVSFYRGPFITGEYKQQVTLPARSSDPLIQKNAHNTLEDVSYAAAWELGRLLMLNSKKASVELFNWKRRHRQQLKQKEEQLIHLPIKPISNPPDADPGADIVTQWFRDLSLLKQVPFNYLVPYEDMLPVESIRFFQVDPVWVDCLIDGAFSIGRVMTSDYHLDQQLSGHHPKYGATYGLLLRSDVVAGWPHLRVDVGPNDDSSTLLRMDRLSSHVLLCLFSGTPSLINIHMRPEGLHFGVNEDDTKSQRDAQGRVDANNSVNIPWQDETRRVINLGNLASQLNATTSEQFALEMIEGVPKVRFQF